ncbi:MAG: hypothetical protein VX257_02130, partial [Planctomycetota bacterium]|nr:hypothetical protein [Planctomycetota bacterium]
VTLSGALTGGGAMTVRDGAAQSYAALTVDSLDIQDATTSVTLGGALTVSGAVNIDSGDTIAINAAINTSGSSSGTVDIDGTGVTTIASAGDINAGGAVAFGAAKSGTLTTSGDIDTSNDNITFTNAVTLGGNVDIDTTGGSAGNILFSAAIATGGNNLALDAGTAGNVTLSGALTGKGAMTVRDGAAQSYAALTLTSLTISDATTSVTLGGALTTDAAASITSGGTIVQNAALTAGTTLTLNAEGGVDLNQNVTSAGATVVDTDTGDDGTGDFDLAASKAFTTTNNTLQITSNDIILAGTLSSGSSTTTLLVSDGGTIGVGDTSGNMSISKAELQNITASTLTIGGSSGTGNITVDNLVTANTGNISATLALVTNSNISFSSNASAFTPGMDVDAGGTIAIDVGLTGTTFDIDGTGVTTIASAGDINASGAVAFGAAKSGTLTTSGDIDTSNDNITFTRAVTLGGNVDIDTTGGSAGNILFSAA